MRPRKVSERVRALVRDFAVGSDAGDPELDAQWGEPGLSAGERLFAWNTLEVLALGAGQPQRPVNAVPHEAVAHCQLRFVVGTDWQALGRHLREHLDRHGFPEVQVEVGMSCAATRLSLDDPWVGWAMESLQRSAGRRPTLLPNLEIGRAHV